MSSFELLSLLFSIVALAISIFTAYKTFLAQFQADIYVRPRIILTRINNLPALSVGCEILNSGSRAGLIDDMVISIRFRQSSGKGLDKYTFYPFLMRNDFNFYRSYTGDDFEPFQSIAVPANTRLVKYVVFKSGNQNFSPAPGTADVTLSFRFSKSEAWKNISNGTITFEIDSENSSEWGNQNGKNVMIETIENFQRREKLLDGM